MKSKKDEGILPINLVNIIYSVRNQQVMLDRDLASLYGVETRVLKQAVRRNLSRFPIDFMFEMTDQEFKEWKSQNVISKSDSMGWRYKPMVFTEHGILMLSSILNSKRAVEMNIQIMRIFITMRQMIMSHKDILLKIQGIEHRVGSHDALLKTIFSQVKLLIVEKNIAEQHAKRKRIGFRP
jgi:hypothetical protein